MSETLSKVEVIAEEILGVKKAIAGFARMQPAYRPAAPDDLRPQLTTRVSGSDLNESTVGNRSPHPVTAAVEREYENTLLIEEVTSRAGYADAQVQAPKHHSMVLEAREVAIHLAACRVTSRPSDEGDGEELGEGAGEGAIAELPPGVPTWPPKPFFPRGKFYTKN